MRITDIEQGARPTSHDITPELYIPYDRCHPRELGEYTVGELRRGLCAKSGGNLAVCRRCPGGCRWGAELIRRADATQEEEHTNEDDPIPG